MKKTFTLLLFACVYVSAMYAQNTYTIQGKVTDKKTNEELIGVKIRIEGTVIGTITDTEIGRASCRERV